MHREHLRAAKTATCPLSGSRSAVGKGTSFTRAVGLKGSVRPAWEAVPSRQMLAYLRLIFSENSYPASLFPSRLGLGKPAAAQLLLGNTR